MLSTHRLEVQNGHATTVRHVFYEQEAPGFIAECVCNCGAYKITLSACGTTEQLALENLREMVYAEHSQIVFERAGWKCEDCGSVAPLTAHHQIFRSHGRDDRITNLRALDQRCHERRHKERQSVEEQNVRSVDKEAR